MKKPVVTSYLSVHQYLQDLYAYLKVESNGFSYERWSRQLGLKSRSFLRMVVIGKRRITDSFVETFCQKMNYSSSEKQYFTLLVGYSQSRSQEQKNLYGKKLIELVTLDADRVSMENYYDFFSSPLHSRLLVMIGFDDIQRTTSALANLLQVSINEAEAALKHLEKMNLIAAVGSTDANEETSWQGKNKLYKIPDKLGSAALSSFHEASLKEAIEAQKKPFAERRFRSLLMPFNSNEYEDFLQDLETFIQQSLLKFKADQLGGRKLYQVNFNNFTVSESPSECAQD